MTLILLDYKNSNSNEKGTNIVGRSLKQCYSLILSSRSAISRLCVNHCILIYTGVLLKYRFFTQVAKTT